MYHQVLGDAPVPGDRDYFAVSRSTFGRHLDAIRSFGVVGSSLRETVAHRGQGRVALTFDDGTIGHFEHALPELAARGMTATFFATTAWVGRPGHVSWAQLRAMDEAGMEIGSHTRSHPFLSELSREALWEELAGSRQDLEDALGREVRSLALPGGDHPRSALRGLVGAAGYRIVATSRWGVNRDDTDSDRTPSVRRCTVRDTLGDREFRRVLEGDPWIMGARALRGLVLNALRAGIGPSRYARWRRRFLETTGARA